jgi:hypothetical protein
LTQRWCERGWFAAALPSLAERVASLHRAVEIRDEHAGRFPVRANRDSDASSADGGFAFAFVRERIAQSVRSGEGLRALLDVKTRSGLLLMS